MQYIKLIRVHHYIKNVLIFFPIVFGHKLLDYKSLSRVFTGFVIFSLIASVVYIINDIKDAEEDRKHCEKCKRPIACGAILPGEALKAAAILVVLAMLLNVAVLKEKAIISAAFVGLYLFLNIAYSKGLKNIPIIDIALLVSGFVIRVLYGAEISDVKISKWLYLTVVAMSFYMALGKRRNELLRQTDTEYKGRKVLQYYNYAFLDKNMYMSLALTIIFYSLWTVDDITVQKISSDHLIWTVPMVILICLKYSLNIEKDSNGDPVEVILHDWILCVMVLAFAFITMVMVYC